MLPAPPDPEVQRMWEKELSSLEWASGKLCSWVAARVQFRRGDERTVSGDVRGSVFSATGALGGRAKMFGKEADEALGPRERKPRSAWV